MTLMLLEDTSFITLLLAYFSNNSRFKVKLYLPYTTLKFDYFRYNFYFLAVI